MVETYYNTTEESGEALEGCTAKASRQEDIIFGFFRKTPGQFWTPFDIKYSALPDAPITSVRRAITNLANRGLITKTKIKRSEQYGRNNFCWSYKPAQVQLRF